MATLIRVTELSRRISWFITIRWLALIGVIIAINFAQFVQNLSLPYNLLYVMSGILTIVNVIYMAFNNYIINKKTYKDNVVLIHHFANVQVLTDLIILTILLYGSGGLQSPFIYYYVFHMVIASMLLPNFWAYIQGSIAMCFFSLLIILSSYNYIPNYALPGFGPTPGDEKYLDFVLGKLCGLVSTIFILIFMSGSIVKQLKNKEALLAKANEGLIEANEEKSRYVLQVTHELRAPLAAIQGYLKVAIEGYVGTVEGKLKDMLQNISNRTTNMLVMVNELLDLAALKNPKKKILNKEPHNINSVINKELRFFENELLEKKIDVEVSAAPALEITADIEQLHILLTNLISNAIKYSHIGGKLKINASKPFNNVLLKVSDNGIGIPEKDQKSIFLEYFRSQNAVTKEKNGTGLGLTIVEKIVKRHNGNIWVESSSEHGSTFFIELPS